MPVFCWNLARLESSDRRGFPDPHGNPCYAAAYRYLDFHFFTNAAGGNAMMFMNLIWAWGHPESISWFCRHFGVYSEVVRDILRQAPVWLSIDGDRDQAICILSFTVWLITFSRWARAPT